MYPNYLRLIFLLLFAFRPRATADDQVAQWLDCADVDEADAQFFAAELAASKCGKDKFHCRRSGECIDRFKVCDLITDCVDWTDENGCGACDFTQSELRVS